MTRRVWRSLGLPLIASAIVSLLQTLSTGVSSPTRTADLEPGVTRETPARPEPASQPSLAAPTARAVGAALDNPLTAIPLDRLQATRDRPLFSPSRRTPPPPVVASAAVAAPPPPPAPPKPSRPDLSLVGTVVGTSDSIGVFIDSATKAVVRLHTGEGHDGWILSAISDRKATLANDGATAVLALPSPGSEQDEATPSPYRRGTRRVHH